MGKKEELYQPPSYAPPAYRPEDPPKYQPVYRHFTTTNENFLPPPGPPPGYSEQSSSQQPPPLQLSHQYEHNWQAAVPDTSGFPPPPSFSYDVSPGANATSKQAQNGAEWCRHNLLWQPRALTGEQREGIQAGSLSLLKPEFEVRDQDSFKGDVTKANNKYSKGWWRVKTEAKCGDSMLLSELPLYSAAYDDPRNAQGNSNGKNSSTSKTIYYEVRINNIAEPNTAVVHQQQQTEKHRFHFLGRKKKEAKDEDPQHAIALGFIAPPYPFFRLPGWHRGSLGVHSDEGHKFINDIGGGSPFTQPFANAQCVGIGMTFKVLDDNTLDTELFFTRDGQRIPETWNAVSGIDSETGGEEGTRGLCGECDLFAAVGVFGKVDIEIVFKESEWLYRPSANL